jgi:16S rRNA (guanine527-N7)-methyltransferase
MSETLHDMLLNGAAESGVSLTERHIDGLLLLMLQLRKWNRKFNLTAITKEREIVVKHFLDSLTVVPLIPEGSRVLDIGSGGGFPAIPLALVRSDLDVTSVDAAEKKIFFQRHAVRLLGIERFTALHARGESLRVEHVGRYNVILSRAFSSLSDFATLAQPLLAPGGVIIAMKGRSGSEDVTVAAPLLMECGLVVREVMDLRLPVSGDVRSLVVMGAVRA